MPVKINAVVSKALTDKKFARDLKKEAADASKAGEGSPEHKKLLSTFGLSEEQAKQMVAIMPAICATTTNRCGSGP